MSVWIACQGVPGLATMPQVPVGVSMVKCTFARPGWEVWACCRVGLLRTLFVVGAPTGLRVCLPANRCLVWGGVKCGFGQDSEAR